MPRKNIDTDMAVPSNIDAVNNYYSNNLIKIIEKDSLSSSSETISSENSEQVSKLKTNNYDPTLKSITVNDSSNVHFGNKIFNGPVIIKQNIIMREDDNEKRNDSINLGFEGKYILSLIKSRIELKASSCLGSFEKSFHPV